MTTNLETLKKVRDKALHRYTLAERNWKRATDEYTFCMEEVTMLSSLIRTE